MFVFFIVHNLLNIWRLFYLLLDLYYYRCSILLITQIWNEVYLILQRISADCSIYQVMDKFDSHHLWIQLLKDFQYLLFAGSLHYGEAAFPLGTVILKLKFLLLWSLFFFAITNLQFISILISGQLTGCLVGKEKMLSLGF